MNATDGGEEYATASVARRATLPEMPPGVPPTPPLVVALAVVAAVGACMLAAAVMAPTMLGDLGAWPVAIVGVVALVGALAALGMIQHKRDRPLR